jgi:hypothetical protein
MSDNNTKMNASDYSATTTFSKLDHSTTIDIPKEHWSKFFNDFSKRRYGWNSNVEIISKSDGDEMLSEGLILNGITHEDKAGKCTIEISLGDENDHHQSHSIKDATKVSYLGETDKDLGVLDIEEANGTKTLISLMNPMPIAFGYASYQSVSVV